MESAAQDASFSKEDDIERQKLLFEKIKTLKQENLTAWNAGKISHVDYHALDSILSNVIHGPRSVAMFYYEKCDYAKAVEWFKISTEIDKELFSFFEGRSYKEIGNSEAAMICFKRGVSLGNYECALEIVNGLKLNEPENQKQRDEFLKDCKKIVLFDLGKYYKRQKDEKNMIFYLLLVFHQGCEAADRELSSYFLNTRDLDKIKEFGSLAMREGLPFSINSVGEYFRSKMKDHLTAKALYKRAVQLKYPPSMSGLGLIYMRLGKYEKAKEYFEMAVAYKHLQAPTYLDMCVRKIAELKK